MRVRARHTYGITTNATNDSRPINLRYEQLVTLLSRCERVVFSIAVIHMPLKTHIPVRRYRTRIFSDPRSREEHKSNFLHGHTDVPECPRFSIRRDLIRRVVFENVPPFV